MSFDFYRFLKEPEKPMTRSQLTLHIINTQQRIWGTELQYLCPICNGVGDDRNGDLHESFIRRGRNVPQWVWESEWNCTVAHHTCHIPEGQTDETKYKILKHKLRLGINPNWILQRLYDKEVITVIPSLLIQE